MVKIGLVSILFFSVISTYAQESGLILIDADNQQAFFVRMGDKMYPSSNIGHLTISNLKDSIYLITIGFPGTQYSEEQFNVKVSKKDQGFQLKLVDGKEWVLYNWQTKENSLPIRSVSSPGTERLTRGVRMDDPFSRLMAAVVNDTLVLYNNFTQDLQADSAVLNSPDKKPSEKPKDSAAALLNPAMDQAKVQPASEKKPAKVKTSKNLRAGSAIMLGMQSSESAMQLVYVSYSKKGIADTVTIEIPLDSAAQHVAAASPAPENNKVILKQNTADSAVVMVDPATVPKKKLPNTNCKKAATDHDVDQLRVKMMNEYMEDHRLDVVKKFFQSRCMTVKQVKSLAELFSSDKGRYYFFETAYQSVFDPENYSQLAETLVDNNYKDQFNTHFLGQKN